MHPSASTSKVKVLPGSPSTVTVADVAVVVATSENVWPPSRDWKTPYWPEKRTAGFHVSVTVSPGLADVGLTVNPVTGGALGHGPVSTTVTTLLAEKRLGLHEGTARIRKS